MNGVLSVHFFPSARFIFIIYYMNIPRVLTPVNCIFTMKNKVWNQKYVILVGILNDLYYFQIFRMRNSRVLIF